MTYVIDRLSDIKMQTDYRSSSLSQRVAAEWLCKGYYEEHVANVRIHLKERRRMMVQTLNKYCADIATWDIPSGGFFYMAKDCT